MTLGDYVAKAGDLFVLPQSVNQLKACIDDEATNIDDVAGIVATDPALTSQLLKIANSAMYRFPKKIETITRALQVIGMRSTYDLALAYGVSNAFSDIPKDVINLDEFWMQSVVCGILAKQIAEFHNHREAERFFVTGLLHNIGELSVVALNPDNAKQAKPSEKNVTPAILQHEVLDFDYADLSGKLMQSWGLPESIWQPLTQLHSTDEATLTRDTQIIRLAYLLMLEAMDSELYPPTSLVKEAMYTRLDMELQDLEELLETTLTQSGSIKSLFSESDI